jgi:EmrB/QacA subfamily drug resistance transporter
MVLAQHAVGEVVSGERRRWWVLVSIGVGTFMSGLDASIVNTVLPVMSAGLNTSVAQIEWVLTIYLFVLSSMLLGFGRLGDMRGHKDVFVIGFAGFMVASALCGLAPTAFWLIVFRALQALAAAMLYSNAPAILISTFPARERGRALGLQVTMTYLGFSLGPSLGGVLTMHFGWPSIFFANVPVALLGIFLSYRMIPRDRPEGKTPPFDIFGAVLFFVGLFALMLALNQGYQWGWFAPLTLGLIAGSIVTLAVFGAVENRRAHPMLDLSLFRHPVFTGALFSSMMSYVAQTALLFLPPLYLIRGRGFDPEHAGFVLTALPVMMMLTAPVSGALSDRLGSRGPATLGLLILTAGLLLLSHAGAVTPLPQVIGALAVCGIGFGIFIAPNNSRILGAAPLNRRGIASGILAAARNVGMVLGVALSGAVYTTVLARSGGNGVSGVFNGVASALKVVSAITAIAVVTSWAGPNPQARRLHQDQL